MDSRYDRVPVGGKVRSCFNNWRIVRVVIVVKPQKISMGCRVPCDEFSQFLTYAMHAPILDDSLRVPSPNYSASVLHCYAIMHATFRHCSWVEKV